MKIKTDEFKICECLKEVIEIELKIGNSVKSFDEMPEWPKKDSRFIFLRKKVNSKSLINIPEWVSVRVNNDMHYTWYNEIYCKQHHDLLAAGDM